MDQANYRIVEKYCGHASRMKLQGAIQNISNRNIKIANTGMVSSGKSSLYNVLTESLATERFPTGAARTTKTADTYQSGNVEYIDTPGIDVREADDDVAFQTVMGADIILMVHNVKTGPMIRSEVEWLKQIADGMPSKDVCRQRLVFVCSWSDAREKENGFEEIVQDIKESVFQTVGVEIPFFVVSAKKYISGITKDKPALCEKSGIIELKAFLEASAAEYSVHKQQQAWNHLEKTLGEIRNKLLAEQKIRALKVENEKSAVRRNLQSRRNTWRNVLTTFRSYRTVLTNLKDELRRI